MARTAGYDRDEALQKAQALFWEKGFHATSLKDIEAALDMRPGSIYAAFGSKEALFSESLDLYARQSAAEFCETLRAHPSPLAGLAAHIRAIGRVCDRNTPSRACMLVKTVLETPENDSVLRDAAEGLMRRVEAAFAERFRAAKAAGELPATADPDRMASRLQAEIAGLRAYAQRSDAAGRVEAIAQDIAADLEARHTA